MNLKSIFGVLLVCIFLACMCGCQGEPKDLEVGAHELLMHDCSSWRAVVKEDDGTYAFVRMETACQKSCDPQAKFVRLKSSGSCEWKKFCE